MISGIGNTKGFSLLEVVVAITILSIGLVFVLQAFSAASRVNGITMDYTEAVFLAEDILQELEFKEKTASLRSGEENLAASRSGVAFNCKYSLLDSADYPGVYELYFDTAWKRAQRERNEDLAVYTYLRK